SCLLVLPLLLPPPSSPLFPYTTLFRSFPVCVPSIRTCRLDGTFSLCVQNPNSPFFRQGSLSAESTRYPVGSRAAASSAWPSGSSARMTHSPFLWEEVTFFTRKARRTVSLTWASHMLQAMPSIFAVVLYIVPSCSARVSPAPRPKPS